MFPALSLLCFVAPLDRARLELLQQCTIHSHAVVQTDCRRHVFKLFERFPGITDTTTPEDDNEARVPAPLVPPPSGWRYPNFEPIVASIRKHITIDRSCVKPGQDAMVYTLEEGFVHADRSWIEYVRDERMTYNSKVLYRPEIVKDLVQRIEDGLATSKRKRGLLVKGPLGGGKSYSIINLTRYLIASEKYWVTIIPDCEYWRDVITFFDFLLKSVGVDPSLFGLAYDAATDKNLAKLIGDIDTVLSQHGRKWVFIFDQVNRIFARPQFQLAKDVGVLPFPFELMKTVMKPGRIISIISASANNDVSHRENHEGFDVFEHPTQFHRDEVKLLYPFDQFSKWDWEEVEYATGLIPLYLKLFSEDLHAYTAEVRSDIEFSLGKLEKEKQQTKENRWNNYVESAVQCLLGTCQTDDPLYLDRKFSRVQRSSKKPYKYSVVPLFPLVEEVYRAFFWKHLCEYIEENEAQILNVSRDAPQKVRGRLFEQIVTSRLVRSRLSAADVKCLLEDANLAQEIDLTVSAAQDGPCSVIQVTGRSEYPQLLSGENRSTYFVPMASNFPATNLIVQVGKVVIAFQFHISSDHKEVLTSLREKVSAAGWNGKQVQKIILVYLSPTKDTAHEMKHRIARQACLEATAADWYITLCYSIGDLTPLRDLQWTS